MCIVHKHTLLSRNEFPTINEVPIKAIWSRHIWLGRGKDPLGDDSTDYYECQPLDYRKSSIKVKEVPEIFKPLFTKFVHKGRIYTTRHLSYRESDSCNGSFTDETMTLYAYKDGNTSHLNLYRAEPYMDKYNNTISISSKLGKLLINTIGSRSIITELCASTGVWFEQTYLRKEGNLYYPDTGCIGWRRCWMTPYVHQKYGSKKHIRAYSEHLNAHLYLEQVSPTQGMENLLCITFPRNYENRPDEFCNIHSWAPSKKEAPGDYIRYTIKQKNNNLKVLAMIGNQIQFEEFASGYFYKINKISYI